MKEKYVLKMTSLKYQMTYALKWVQCDFSCDKFGVIKMLKNDGVLSWNKQSMFQTNVFGSIEFGS